MMSNHEKWEYERNIPEVVLNRFVDLASEARQLTMYNLEQFSTNSRPMVRVAMPRSGLEAPALFFQCRYALYKGT